MRSYCGQMSVIGVSDDLEGAWAFVRNGTMHFQTSSTTILDVNLDKWSNYLRVTDTIRLLSLGLPN